MTRSSNAPYEPINYPDMPEPWRGLLARFLRFCEHVTIESKELGLTPLILMASQRFCIEEMFDGLAHDIHDFVILKGRQLGVSTVLWALDLFWLTRFSGLQAMYIADDEGNKEIHRGYISGMYESLSSSFSRGPWLVNNRFELRWRNQKKWRTSRVMWAFVNRRDQGRLGISRGVNYVHGTEIDTWYDKDGVRALQASLAETHPYRLYVWEGTGRGYGILYDMWEQAKDAHRSRAIFVGFWRGHRKVTREQRALWTAYGEPPPTPDEIEWGEAVQRQFGYTVRRDQLAWWRYEKNEGKQINGDEEKMLEQHPWLPEQSFRSVGSTFLTATTKLHLRRRLDMAPPAQTFRYDWGPHFDSKDDGILIDVPEEAATLRVWEEPIPGMVYVIAADPAFGSGPDADRYAATVWKCFPDALQQVAEYCTPLGAMYQFAWVLAHLGGLYRVGEVGKDVSEDHLILEIGGPGRAVHEELARMAEYGYGLTKRGHEIQDVIAGIQHFLYRRLDSMSGGMLWHFNTTTELRLQIFEQLRDTAERGTLVVRSHDMVEELCALRRNESSKVEAGGVAHDDLAFTAALAVHCWLQNVIPAIEDAVAPLTPAVNAPKHAGESMLRTFLGGLRQEEEKPKMVYGVKTRAPGRWLP